MGLVSSGEIRKEELIVERFLIPVRPFGINDPEYAKRLSDDFLNAQRMKQNLWRGNGAVEVSVSQIQDVYPFQRIP